jgi:predicted amidophosphoribosyltransferase
MVVCISCSEWGNGPLCEPCRYLLKPAPPTITDGLAVTTAFEHESVARRLVHVLKYEGIEVAASLLGTAMLAVLPGDAVALVPVPRALARRMRYGIDPAVALARVVAMQSGLPMVRGLAAQPWWPAHAGMDRASRRSPRLRLVKEVPTRSVLVDDVLTTGATLQFAGRLLGVARGLTATRAGYWC